MNRSPSRTRTLDAATPLDIAVDDDQHHLRIGWRIALTVLLLLLLVLLNLANRVQTAPHSAPHPAALSLVTVQPARLPGETFHV